MWVTGVNLQCQVTWRLREESVPIDKLYKSRAYQCSSQEPPANVSLPTGRDTADQHSTATVSQLNCV